MESTNIYELGTEPMNIWELQEYAKDNGYNTGRFLCVNDKGIFEMQ